MFFKLNFDEFIGHMLFTIQLQFYQISMSNLCGHGFNTIKVSLVNVILHLKFSHLI
jgi:hypothetical protein